jgi:hypothetical protein
MGKGVRLSDVLVVIAIVLPVSALAGGLLGFFSNRFGLTQPVRVAVIVLVVSVAGQIARMVLARRVKARSMPPEPQG